jgi:hypothetical protein
MKDRKIDLQSLGHEADYELRSGFVRRVKKGMKKMEKSESSKNIQKKIEKQWEDMQHKFKGDTY